MKERVKPTQVSKAYEVIHKENAASPKANHPNKNPDNK